MAAAAEQIQTNYGLDGFDINLENGSDIVVPPVRLISEIDYDRLTQLRFNRWLGSTAIRTSIETDSQLDRIDRTNLLEALRQAKAGSAEATKRVDINVATAVFEVCFKDDYVGSGVETWINENGDRIQYGQSTKSVQHNALLRRGRHEKLIEITKAEGLNSFRIDDAQRAGLLKDNYLIIVSVVPNGVPEEDLGPDGDGYFLDNLTLSIQATTEENEGLVITTPAFTAGVEAEDKASFEEKLAKRHDIAALINLYQSFNLVSPTTAVGFIENGLLIPKELMPNGVVDFMRWFHESADNVRGRVVKRLPEDYITLRSESKKREASLANTRAKVREDLLRATDSMFDPMDPINMLWRLVKTHTVDDSVENTNIDPKVFGQEAATYIWRARQNLQTGSGQNYWLMQRAQETAVISTCGGGFSQKRTARDSKLLGDSPVADITSLVTRPNLFETPEEQVCPEVKDGQQVKCPDCKEIVRAIVPSGEEKIYCSNPDCDSAHPRVKRKLKAA